MLHLMAVIKEVDQGKHRVGKEKNQHREHTFNLTLLD